VISRDLGLHQQLDPIVIGSGHCVDAGHSLDAAGESVRHQAIDIVLASIRTDQGTTSRSKCLISNHDV